MIRKENQTLKFVYYDENDYNDMIEKTKDIVFCYRICKYMSCKDIEIILLNYRHMQMKSKKINI